LLCPYWKKKGPKVGNVDLIIGKHLKFRGDLCCFKKRRFVNTRKGEALFIEITQGDI
jgi:hypothetical protein